MKQGNGMAKAKKVSVEAVDAASSNGLVDVVKALDQVAEVLSDTGAALQQLAQSFATGGQAAVAAGPAAKVNTWDDPFSERVASVNPGLSAVAPTSVSTNAFPRLQISIADQQQPVGLHNPGSAGFRYWVANEALVSGVNFWGSLLPNGTTWSTANPMRVSLLEPLPRLNASYSRVNGLRFFSQGVQGFQISSCESPDVVRHELGHAVLDALRPQLFHGANVEAAAFHEAFGDMSAILCALQGQSMRRRVLDETAGRLNANSRLSRVAEQLGWGIRQTRPTAVDRDCLRNAANRFFYRDPDLLPPSAPANLLSTEAHSFSRVFTGAFLDILARMFTAVQSSGEQGLLAVSRDLGQLLVDAARRAPIVDAYFSQVAAAMVRADQLRFNGRNRAAITSAFLEHGILSVGSAMQIASAAAPARSMAAADADDPSASADDEVAEDRGYQLGLGQTPELPLRAVSIGPVTVSVHAADQPARLRVHSATMGMAAEAKTRDATESARIFLEALIQRQEVDLGVAAERGISPETTLLERLTHQLVQEDGKTVLKRNHFACGCLLSRTLVCATE
jgi:hypothetical protein